MAQRLDIFNLNDTHRGGLESDESKAIVEFYLDNPSAALSNNYRHVLTDTNHDQRSFEPRHYFAGVGFSPELTRQLVAEKMTFRDVFKRIKTIVLKIIKQVAKKNSGNDTAPTWNSRYAIMKTFQSASIFSMPMTMLVYDTMQGVYNTFDDFLRDLEDKITSGFIEDLYTQIAVNLPSQRALGLRVLAVCVVVTKYKNIIEKKLDLKRYSNEVWKQLTVGLLTYIPFNTRAKDQDGTRLDNANFPEVKYYKSLIPFDVAFINRREIQVLLVFKRYLLDPMQVLYMKAHSNAGHKSIDPSKPLDFTAARIQFCGLRNAFTSYVINRVIKPPSNLDPFDWFDNVYTIGLPAYLMDLFQIAFKASNTDVLSGILQLIFVEFFSVLAILTWMEKYQYRKEDPEFNRDFSVSPEDILGYVKLEFTPATQNDYINKQTIQGYVISTIMTGDQPDQLWHILYPQNHHRRVVDMIKSIMEGDVAFTKIYPGDNAGTKYATTHIISMVPTNKIVPVTPAAGPEYPDANQFQNNLIRRGIHPVPADNPPAIYNDTADRTNRWKQDTKLTCRYLVGWSYIDELIMVPFFIDTQFFNIEEPTESKHYKIARGIVPKQYYNYPRIGRALNAAGQALADAFTDWGNPDERLQVDVGHQNLEVVGIKRIRAFNQATDALDINRVSLTNAVTALNGVRPGGEYRGPLDAYKLALNKVSLVESFVDVMSPYQYAKRDDFLFPSNVQFPLMSFVSTLHKNLEKATPNKSNVPNPGRGQRHHFMFTNNSPVEFTKDSLEVVITDLSGFNDLNFVLEKSAHSRLLHDQEDE